MVILLTVIVGVQVSRCELKHHGSPAGIWGPWSELCMVLIQDFVVSRLDGIHFPPDFAQDDPWDIPRLLGMVGQHVFVMALHPNGVLEGVLVDLAFVEVLGPSLMLIMQRLANLGC